MTPDAQSGTSKGTNLALGLSDSLEKFSASQGAASVFGAWDKGFLQIPFLATRTVFESKFAAIMDTFIQNGGRIKFDLTGLKQGIEGVTTWELRQILGAKRWEAATDFSVTESNSWATRSRRY